MKMILLQDVKSVGKKGDLINASEGYAKNFLLPRKLAVEATKSRGKGENRRSVSPRTGGGKHGRTGKANRIYARCAAP